MFARPLGLEPRTTILETVMLPLHYGRVLWFLKDSNPNSADQNRFTTIRRGGNKVGKVGLEPNISDFSDQRELTICATSPWLPI